MIFEWKGQPKGREHNYRKNKSKVNEGKSGARNIEKKMEDEEDPLKTQ